MMMLYKLDFIGWLGCKGLGMPHISGIITIRTMDQMMTQTGSKSITGEVFFNI